MKKTYVFAIFVIFVIDPMFAKADIIPTVEQYLAERNTSKYDQYIKGIDSGLDWAAQEAYIKYNKQIFCKPGDIDLPISQIKKLINVQLERDNTFYSKYKDAPLIGLALKNAYVRNFPCSK